MDIPETCWLIATIFFILLNAMFILSEVAIMEAHKSQIEKFFQKKDKIGDKLLEIVDEPRDYLTAMQIGSVSCNLLIGICSTIFIMPLIATLLKLIPWQINSSHLRSYDILISCFFTAIIILLFLQFITILARRLATHNPIRALVFSLKFILVWRFFFLPFIKVFRSIANAILGAFGINPNLDSVITEDEVKDLIEKATVEGTFEKVEQDIVDRIFHMSDQTTYSLMTPRTQMLWLDIEDSLEENLSVIKNSNNSMFIVGRDNLDEIVGILYTKDLLDTILDKQPIDIEALVRKPLFVPKAMETFRLLDKFRNCDSNEAIVLDEYGGVVGFITIYDIIDEVLGDVTKTSLETPPQLSQQDDHNYILDGLYEIDDFKAKFGIEALPHEEHRHFKTMGGFLTSYFGYIPKVKEVRIWNNFRFEVLAMDKARIAKIKLQVLE